ncbi:MAG TPA: NADH-quinone oxidoreductase subunit L [Chitinophagaceae bacterium]|nr:NADH-quinone oxidoreductase subunit L [Chitinophagaceae bacterium]
MDIFNLLWLIPALPLCSFLILAIFGSKLSGRAVAIIGCATVGLAALLTIWMGITFLTAPPAGNFYQQTLWVWLNTGGFSPSIALYLDPLSLIFIFVVTFVGFLIHWYSSEFMQGDEGYARFFAYMNLFIFSMLTLVLANNLLLLYLGWEGVGLCSFLLIGFWYRDPVNSYAARKAFIVTRIGDTAMIIGLFLLLSSFNTLNIAEILTKAPGVWSPGSSRAFWAAILLLGGALGKSAQLPLQTWLPDAMAGPTPVSALIHAATMVTAGVYLIARTHVLFELAPVVQLLVAIIGAATLVVAGFSALAQKDIKRVLAYSTISQIGYMFLALGVGAWSAAIFHFMIHAFFKALLFLGAGAVILAMDHEHDMFKMGGLRKKMPVVFWTFLFGSGALAALPLITAGFYSKDQILFFTMASVKGSIWLWLAGIVGAFITSVYTFRMVFVTFFGEQKMQVHYHAKNCIKIPLIILGILSLIAGFIELPHAWGNFAPFSDFLNGALPQVQLISGMESREIILEVITAIIALVGVYAAWVFFLKKPQLAYRFKTAGAGKGIYRFFFEGWMFDRLYDLIFVRPIVWLSKIDRRDFVDRIYGGIGQLNMVLNKSFSRTQNGLLRWYLFGVAFGAALLLTIILFL